LEELKMPAVWNDNKELWWAAVAAIFIAGIYVLVIFDQGGVPPAGEFFGHAIGILGFLLMILTEVLYSLRKRSRSVRWGRMSDWLQFHIFTGLVGPFMVLLHTSWKFFGLAGMVTWLTVIVVLSGFTGRYIYTQIPRTADGIELETPQGEIQAGTITKSRQMLALWHWLHIPIGLALFVAAFVHIGGALYFSTFSK
jgi:hypothetical protein